MKQRLEDVHRALADALVGRLRTGAPAEVTNVSLSDQTVDACPYINVAFDDPETEGLTYVRPPIIPNIPIMFPGGDGYSVTFPLSQGQTVWLLYADRSLDEWQTAGGESEPADPRRFDITDCVAYPGTRSPSDPLSEIEASSMVIAGQLIKLGSKDGTSPVAIAEFVESFLNEFISQDYAAHIHSDPISGTTGAISAPPTRTTPTAGEFDADGVEATQ
jgi:hypothetical protein